MNIETDERRAVLRICHDVDHAGHVLDVHLEPLHVTALGEIATAAWHAARRCHPWIVGDQTATQLDNVKQIALRQVNHLLTAANELMCVLMITKPPCGEHAGEQWREGYRAATTDFTSSAEFNRLRDACTDLRGYLPALRGETRTPVQIPKIQARIA